MFRKLKGISKFDKGNLCIGGSMLKIREKKEGPVIIVFKMLLMHRVKYDRGINMNTK